MYLAPFSHIDAIRPGDPVTLEMPYATFLYRAVRHVIVPADDLAVLRSPHHELLALQACNPRFFATQRYIVYARLVRVDPRSGPSLSVEALAAS
jgi:sortase A